MMIRLLALGFALVQAVLGLRLILPFVRVPKGLHDYVPTLITISDWLVAPFKLLISPYDLGQLTRLPGGGDLGFPKYLNQVDPAVVVAMVGWAIVSGLAIFALRVVTRPGR